MTLKAADQSELKMKVIELEQNLEDQRLEHDAYKKLYEAKEQTITDLR